MGNDATQGIPIRLGSSVIGHVHVDTSNGVRYRGALELSSGVVPCRSFLEKAVEAYRRTDIAQPENYQAEWQSWKDALQAINALELTFGDPSVPVDDFEIDDQWHVEFGVPLWWQVKQESRSTEDQ